MNKSRRHGDAVLAAGVGGWRAGVCEEGIEEQRKGISYREDRASKKRQGCSACTSFRNIEFITNVLTCGCISTPNIILPHFLTHILIPSVPSHLLDRKALCGISLTNTFKRMNKNA